MKRKSIINYVVRLLIIPALVVLVGKWYFSYQSYRVFYYPDNINHGHSPEKDRITYEDIYFPSRDGTKLHAWFIPAFNHSPEKAKGTVIYVHGNAANMTGHWPFVSWLPARGYNVFMFDYRGFGNSENTPSVQGLLEDTQYAINYIATRKDIDANKLVIYAQSLGGNNTIAALGIAKQKLKEDAFQSTTEAAFYSQIAKINAIAIDSTFYSYSSIANDKVFSSGLLLRNSDYYSAASYIDKLPLTLSAGSQSTPLLFLHNKGDSIIPYQHSIRLHEKAKQPKQLILIDGGEHIQAMTHYATVYQDKIEEFFAQALMSNSP